MLPSDPDNKRTVQLQTRDPAPRHFHTANGFVVIGAAERTSTEGLTVVILDALGAVQALGLAQICKDQALFDLLVVTRAHHFASNTSEKGAHWAHNRCTNLTRWHGTERAPSELKASLLTVLIGFALCKLLFVCNKAEQSSIEFAKSPPKCARKIRLSLDGAPLGRFHLDKLICHHARWQINNSVIANLNIQSRTRT